MALTIRKTSIHSLGSQMRVVGTLDFDASYPTGGEQFTPRQVGLSRVITLRVDAGNGYLFSPNLAVSPPRIQALQAPGAAGPLVEVAGGTSLVAVTNVPWVAEGY